MLFYTSTGGRDLPQDLRGGVAPRYKISEPASGLQQEIAFRLGPPLSRNDAAAPWRNGIIIQEIFYIATKSYTPVRSKSGVYSARAEAASWQ